MSSNNEIRVVLIGKTGNGKSSTGNSLLHSRSTFRAVAAAESITKDCQAAECPYTDNGTQKTLTVVDTPGFFDTDPSVTNESVEKRIASQIFDMTAPGVHAFLIVTQIGRFTPEEKNTMDFIRHIFGADAVKYCIVVFTRVEDLDGKSLTVYINESPALQELVKACGNRKFAINNKLNGQPLEKQTKELMEIIENTVRMNNGTFYTNVEYQRIEKQRQEEKRREEEAKRQKKKAEEDAVAARVRAEEKKKTDEAVQRTRDEEQRKAKRRESELMSKIEAAERIRSRNNADDDVRSLSSGFQSFGMGSAMPLMCSDMDNGFRRMGSASSGVGGAHGGRFTGEYVSSTGTANGRAIYEGSRGGQYYMSSGGNRSYIPK